MGRSAKMMKRPTKAEKQSRQVNAPSRPSTTSRPTRSLSPEIESTTTRSAIPLFNTSVPGRPGAPPKSKSSQVSAARSAPQVPMDADDDDFESNPLPSTTTPKTTAKERLVAAKQQVAMDQQRSFHKLQGKPKSRGGVGADKFSLGVDYVGLHEKRNGGKFAKKLR